MHVSTTEKASECAVCSSYFLSFVPTTPVKLCCGREAVTKTCPDSNPTPSDSSLSTNSGFYPRRMALKMETSFYHDSELQPMPHSKYANPGYSRIPDQKPNVSGHEMRKSLTLDFANTSKKPHLQNILGTPELNLLKLGSPELERLIIQSNGLVTTTPTPTQFIFPKNVTDEQEQYAAGFVAALERLHREEIVDPNGQPCAQMATSSTATASTSYPGAPPPLSHQPTYHTLTAMSTTTALPGSTVEHHPTPTTAASTVSAACSSSTAPPLQHQALSRPIKEEPQTVPHQAMSALPTGPIDMETQELIKAERKRLRNRIAASKCRKRKLERISRLESKVKDLKTQNTDLSTTANQLREQVCQLKQKVMEHVNSGCQVMLTQQLSFN
ncbi:PREDICTED: transcription factor AP-1-like [Branchiostoma belcheri]|uniref:Transcription factor AP-1-like n=1 Tax=Branchiostoma belcheri TaxID=7741 RepID=A0A6P4ZP34_BRABE|nr:PREDICTED: transcription factor AP-1-like [Branchiostoma belcheri]